jgi:hypothetical protein
VDYATARRKCVPEVEYTHGGNDEPLTGAGPADNATAVWNDVIGSEPMNGGDCINPQAKEMSKKKKCDFRDDFEANEELCSMLGHIFLVFYHN